MSDRQAVFFDEYHLDVKVVWHGYHIASVGEVGAMPKLLSSGIKKMGKETPDIISNGVFWKP